MRRLLVLLTAIALLGSACSDDDQDASAAADGSSTTTTVAAAAEPTTTAAPTTTTEAPPPLDAPDEPGPFAVGRFTTTVIDPARGGRELPVDVLYPVDPRAVSGEPTSPYEIVPGVTVEAPLSHLDAPVADGPHPLVVFSHGSGGVRYQSYFLTEALASHGFVVAAPDHVGNTATDRLLGTPAPFDQVAVDRPLDVSAVIDDLLARSDAPDGPLSGAIDAEHVGVTGHSFGGYTALAVAGGRGDSEPDERVDAIAPLAPAAGDVLLSDADLAAVEVPTLVVGGTRDETTPLDPNSTRPFDLVGGEVVRVDIYGAGHGSFTDLCALSDAIGASDLPDAVKQGVAEQAETGCAADLVPIVDAQRLTTRYVVSFFRWELLGEARYDELLVATPGVTLMSRP